VTGEDFSNEVCTLQSAAQSFTKADGTLVRLYLNSPAHLQPGKVGEKKSRARGGVNVHDVTQNGKAAGVEAGFMHTAFVRLFAWRPHLHTLQFYMLSALIKGAESYCCEECVDTVIAGGVKVSFQCWESPNGTNETRGQVSGGVINEAGSMTR
jgi:hypothetical protein